MKSKIKTYDDVLLHLGINAHRLVYGVPINPFERNINAYIKLQNIVKCFNDGWSPNWNDSSEYKYYPYFDMRSTGRASHGSGRATTETSYGFVFDHTTHADTSAVVCSYLCFKNEEDCTYSAKTFIDIYYDFFVWDVRIDNIKDILK